jgi:prophage maintenance system killer protein
MSKRSRRSRGVLRFGYFAFAEILKVAQIIHKQSGEPIPDIGIGGREKIESSLQTPFQTFAGKSLYLGFYNKAAILFYFLVKNHCLQNGNKRMAILCLSYFSFINKKKFDISQREIYNLAKITAISQNQETAVYRIYRVLRERVSQDLKAIHLADEKYNRRIRNRINIVVNRSKGNQYDNRLKTAIKKNKKRFRIIVP